MTAAKTAPPHQTGGTGGFPPLAKDILVALGVTTTVVFAVSAAMARWIKWRVFEGLRAPEATERIQHLIEEHRINDDDIRRALTPAVVASLLDTPEPHERIIAAFKSDPGRDAVAQALYSDPAVGAIAGALAKDESRERLRRFLEADIEARNTIAGIVGEADISDRVRAVLTSGEVKDQIMNLVISQLDANLVLARAVARALRHGLIEEKDALDSLQGMLVRSAASKDTDALLEAALKRLAERG